MLFERAYSQSSWTTPSLAAMFTGVYPSVHRLGHAGTRYGYTWKLSGERPTLAELLRAAGFRTHAILNNPSLSRRRGFDRGFEAYENEEETAPDRPTEPSYARVVEQLERLRGQDFFLVWHLLDPHWPYYPPPEYRLFVDEAYRGRFAEGLTRDYVKPLVSGQLAVTEAERAHIVNLYDGEIRYVDDQVGRVLAAVDRLGMASSLSVVFTSDHGEALFDRGHFGHVLPLYEGNLRIPLIVRDERFAQARVERIVEAIDLMPTLLELAGVPVPDGLQGRSLLPLLRGRAEDWRDEPAFSEGPQFVERKTLRTDRFRWVWGAAGQVLTDDFRRGVPGFPQFTSRVEGKLYDHAGDAPAPEVAEAHPDLARELRRAVIERMRLNEAKQVRGRSLFRSFYFLDDWRDQALRVFGRVDYEDGVLGLGDRKDSGVLWEVRYPRPITWFDAHVLASCERPARYFTISSDGREGTTLSWRRAKGPKFRNTTIEIDELDETDVLYFTFRQSRPAGCRLKGFYVNAGFGEEEELDAETREKLRALGYVE